MTAQIITVSATTKGGLGLCIQQEPVPVETALGPVFASIDSGRGAILSSGFEYPGRHSRWDIGFIHPALEIVGRKRKFEITALNAQGEVILPCVFDALKDSQHISQVKLERTTVSGEVNTPAEHFTEEERPKQPSIFSVLRTVADLFHCSVPEASHFGLYGAFGYDLILQFEQIEQRFARDPEAKDCHLFLPLEVIVIDRKKEQAHRVSYVISSSIGTTEGRPGGGEKLELSSGVGLQEIESDHAPGEFARQVEKVIQGTKRGDYFEVILSQSFSSRLDESPTALFRKLAEVNPSPYMFLFNLGNEQLIGSSPEIYLRVTDRYVETCPISGTLPRGESAIEDAQQVKALLASAKEEAELTMCTDVDRNDLARVCEPGTVKIIGRRQLEFYSHLIHTVDHLEGTLASGFDALDAFQVHMWACTVTGAPKPAAVQEIENLEKTPRGWYSGAVGALLFNENLNTGIALRTAHCRNGRVSIRAGATILFGSDPEREELETRIKAAALLTALTGVRQEAKPKPDLRPQVSTIPKRKVLLVDYRDSFVHNLASYLREMGAEVTTLRPGFSLTVLEEQKPNLVLLSPGPGAPEDFGIPGFVGELIKREIPIFGVCLGHQGIGQYFGAELKQLPTPVHGKPSTVDTKRSVLFEGIAGPISVGRYHSLYLEASSVPKELRITASSRTAEEPAGFSVVMAIEHTTLPIAGVQFHPESLMTLQERTGHRILENVLRNIAR